MPPEIVPVSAKRLPRADYRLVEVVRTGLAPAIDAGGAVLAVSGGGDSMALLAIVALLDAELRRAGGAERLNWQVAVVDHGLRAEAACEQDQVCSVAEELGWEAKVLDGRTDTDDEAELRRVRYLALRRHAADKRLAWIATAHHRDDQVETVLFRLVRGAGLRGLGGMAPRSRDLLRPLLDVGRAELRGFLERRRLAWSEDASNATSRYARNRIRHTLIPAFVAALGDDALDRIPAMARRMRLDDAYLTAEAQRFVVAAERGRDHALDLLALAEIPQALAGRVLRSWYERQGGRPSLGVRELEFLEAFLAAARHGSGIRLGNLALTLTAGRLHARRTGAS